MAHTLERINNLYLHDSDLNEFRINFDKGILELFTSNFLSEDEGCEAAYIKFSGVYNLNIERIEADQLFTAEVSEHKVEKMENGKFFAKFSIYTSSSYSNISFEYTDHKLEVKPIPC